MPHLHVAAIRNEAALVEVLLAHGASPSLHCIMPDGDDLGIPLHFAARKGQLETAALLLSHGADVNAQDKYGYTPLHEAVLGPYATALPMVKLLLDHGADIDGKSSQGNTPLDRVQNDEYRGRYRDVIKYLKDHGAHSR